MDEGWTDPSCHLLHALEMFVRCRRQCRGGPVCPCPLCRSLELHDEEDVDRKLPALQGLVVAALLNEVVFRFPRSALLRRSLLHSVLALCRPLATCVAAGESPCRLKEGGNSRELPHWHAFPDQCPSCQCPFPLPAIANCRNVRSPPCEKSAQSSVPVQRKGDGPHVCKGTC